MAGNDNDAYSVGQGNSANDSDGNLNGTAIYQTGYGHDAAVIQLTESGGNHQNNGSTIYDSGTSFAPGYQNNDEYTVEQFNGMNDSDVNSSVANVSQFGIDNYAGVTQHTDSGGNSQSNGSSIFDTGFSLATGSINSNDSYAIDQGNNLFDQDRNTTVSNINQHGNYNYAATSQQIESGGNHQSNYSTVGDTGTTFDLFGSGFGNNDEYAVTQFNGLADQDANSNGSAISQVGVVNLGLVSQHTESGGNGQSNYSSIHDTGLSAEAFAHASQNNDSYTVNQSNQMLDMDQNTNFSVLGQAGYFNTANVDQSAVSGGNHQSNSSAIYDAGIALDAVAAGTANDDIYEIGQMNGMADNDYNTNSSTLFQEGHYNSAHLTQGIQSGGNGQSNHSAISDAGFSAQLFANGVQNSDNYLVAQNNQLNDSDMNGNVGRIEQFGSNLAVADQSISSGGNHQSNASSIHDYGSVANVFAHGSENNNDVFDVSQSNHANDSDTNVNGLSLMQGYSNSAFVTQGISSGGNSQSNSSHITDFGEASGFHVADNNSDNYYVIQGNQLDDRDSNTNATQIGQLGYNTAHVSQWADSGGNHQGNASSIFDTGSASDWFGSNNNDGYQVTQSNFLFDNDINTNVAVVAQIGYGQTANVNQGIVSGGNTQHNGSTIHDAGGSGLWGNDNNDTYDVMQVNTLVDNDVNTNGATVTQVDIFNTASVDQWVDSGGNSQGNSSSIFDVGT